MDKLEAFNYMLNLSGMPSLNSAATQNRYAAELEVYLNRVLKRTLRNNPHVFGRLTTLQASGDPSRIDVSEYLRVDYPYPLSRRLVARNGSVWDMQEDDYYVDDIERAVVVSEQSFENIDSHAWQEYIATQAAAEFAKGLSDADINYQAIAAMASKARRMAANENRVDIRNGLGVSEAMRGYKA